MSSDGAGANGDVDEGAALINALSELLGEARQQSHSDQRLRSKVHTATSEAEVHDIAEGNNDVTGNAGSGSRKPKIRRKHGRAKKQSKQTGTHSNDSQARAKTADTSPLAHPAGLDREEDANLPADQIDPENEPGSASAHSCTEREPAGSADFSGTVYHYNGVIHETLRVSALVLVL